MVTSVFLYCLPIMVNYATLRDDKKLWKLFWVNLSEIKFWVWCKVVRGKAGEWGQPSFSQSKLIQPHILFSGPILQQFDHCWATVLASTLTERSIARESVNLYHSQTLGNQVWSCGCVKVVGLVNNKQAYGHWWSSPVGFRQPKGCMHAACASS